jgi:hypothetical protein
MIRIPLISNLPTALPVIETLTNHLILFLRGKAIKLPATHVIQARSRKLIHIRLPILDFHAPSVTKNTDIDLIA